MPATRIEQSKRAWELAHRLIFLGRIVSEREDRDLLVVRTAEICRALGKPDGASIEEVKRYVCRVLEFMQGYGMYMACGCGFLSLRVAPQQLVDAALQEDRDLTTFVPDDLEQYFEHRLLDATGQPTNDVPCFCTGDE